MAIEILGHFIIHSRNKDKYIVSMDFYLPQNLSSIKKKSVKYLLISEYCYLYFSRDL